MPLDSSIYGQQQPTPFNNPFAQLMQMREVKQRQQLVDQQIQSGQALEEERRRKTADAEKQASEMEQFNQVIGNPDLTRDSFLEQVRAKAPGQYEGALKRIEEHDKAAAEIKSAKLQAAGHMKTWVSGMMDDIVASGYSPVVAELTLKEIEAEDPSYKPKLDEYRAQIKQGGPVALKTLVDTLRGKAGEQKTREVKTRNPDGSESIQIVEDKPGQSFESAAAPKPEPTSIDAAIYAARNNPMELNRLFKLKKQSAEAGREPAGPKDVGPLETIIGPNGKPIRVPREQAIGKETVAGQEKPSSGVQKRVLAFFNRAKQADEELEGLESQIQKQSLPGQAWMNRAPNFMQSQLGQSYGAAQRAFTEARLRKDSGAAIPEQEFENDKRTYFAQAGDSTETLEQKRRARAAILASLGFESGQALGEFVGDPDEAKRIVEGYKARSNTTVKPTIKILKIERVP